MSLRKRHPKQRKGKRVAVVTPCNDMVHAHYTSSMIQMLRHAWTHSPKGVTQIDRWTQGDTLLVKAMNAIAQRAIDGGYTHTLWIDSDVGFPADTLNRLMAHGLPIVGVNANTRHPPFASTAVIYDENGLPNVVVTDSDSKGLAPVHRTGFCVILIETAVFQKFGSQPFFDQPWIEERQQFRGPDYVFCDKAREAGFDIAIDHDLSKEVLHIGIYGFNPLTVPAWARESE